jgi:hypothetical protein
LHTKVEGVVVHAVLQFVWHASAQGLVPVAPQFPLHVAVKFTGVHNAVQPPDVSNWHVLGSAIVTSPWLVVQAVVANAFEPQRNGAARASALSERFLRR